MIDINELRRLTQAATPGPWQILTITDEGDATFGTVYDDVDAKFIAAVNPATTSELLDRLEAAEKERDAYKSAYANWTAKTEWLQDEINSGKLPAKYLGMHRADGIKAEIDALRAKIEQMEKQRPVASIYIDGKGEREFDDWKCDLPTGRSLLYALPGAQPAPSIPEGWKLVPIEPTEKMINEGTCASTLPGPRYIDSACAKQCWTNMLAAAPEAKP